MPVIRDSKDWVIVLGLFIFFCSLVGGLTIIACTENRCVATANITSIGGCDKYGTCAVATSDGNKHYVGMPIIGERICVAEKMFWRWE